MKVSRLCACGWALSAILLAACGVGYILHVRALATADRTAQALEWQAARDSLRADGWRARADTLRARMDSARAADSIRIASLGRASDAATAAARRERARALTDTLPAVHRAVVAVSAAYERALASRDSLIAAHETHERRLIASYDARLIAKDSVIAADARQIDAFRAEAAVYRGAAHSAFSIHFPGYLLGVLTGVAGTVAILQAVG